MYGLPGERYHVVVQGQDPYVEWTQRQSSMMTWDKHDFSFYFQKKVTSPFRLDVGENETGYSAALLVLSPGIDICVAEVRHGRLGGHLSGVSGGRAEGALLPRSVRRPDRAH